VPPAPLDGDELRVRPYTRWVGARRRFLSLVELACPPASRGYRLVDPVSTGPV